MKSPSDPPSPSDYDAPWPGYIPHREIDALVERFESATDLKPGEADKLARMIAADAQRLRAHTAQLTSEKLDAAHREARRIVADAVEHADSLRAAGLTVLNARLDEADRLITTLRNACRSELSAIHTSSEDRLDAAQFGLSGASR